MPSRKNLNPYPKLLLLLSLPFLLLTFYSFTDREIKVLGVTLEKTSIKEELCINCQPEEKADSLVVDSLKIDSMIPQNKLDTTQQRILFFGDSMVEGLSKRMRKYAKENGHELLNVIWYSSSTKWWSQTDTLEHYLRKHRPTYLMISIGGNELFVRDLKKRDKYIKDILARLQGLPYVWISPPNWKPDTGICDLILNNVGKTHYFNSERLTFRRGKDHMHPTFSSAAQWMDSVAVWMQDSCAHRIKMRYPTSAKNGGKTEILLPMR
jgi:hypothetical protein